MSDHDFLLAVRDQYVGKPFSFWERLIGGDPIEVVHPSDPEVCIDVSATWEKSEGGSILVLVSESSHCVWRPGMRTVTFVVPAQRLGTG